MARSRTAIKQGVSAPHTDDAERFCEMFRFAETSFGEAAEVFREERRNDGSLSRQTKAFGYQCAVGGVEMIAEFAKRYARTPEGVARQGEPEDYVEATVLADERLHQAVEWCAEAMDECGDVLGIAGERIAAAMRFMMKFRLPDTAGKLRVQAEAAARLFKLEAAHA